MPSRISAPGRYKRNSEGEGGLACTTCGVAGSIIPRSVQQDWDQGMGLAPYFFIRISVLKQHRINGLDPRSLGFRKMDNTGVPCRKDAR